MPFISPFFRSVTYSHRWAGKKGKLSKKWRYLVDQPSSVTASSWWLFALYVPQRFSFEESHGVSGGHALTNSSAACSALSFPQPFLQVFLVQSWTREEHLLPTVLPFPMFHVDEDFSQLLCLCCWRRQQFGLFCCNFKQTFSLTFCQCKEKLSAWENRPQHQLLQKREFSFPVPSVLII